METVVSSFTVFMMAAATVLLPLSLLVLTLIQDHIGVFTLNNISNE